jgi:hypothetical protein
MDLSFSQSWDLIGWPTQTMSLPGRNQPLRCCPGLALADERDGNERRTPSPIRSGEAQKWRSE